MFLFFSFKAVSFTPSPCISSYTIDTFFSLDLDDYASSTLIPLQAPPPPPTCLTGRRGLMTATSYPATLAGYRATSTALLLSVPSRSFVLSTRHKYLSNSHFYLLPLQDTQWRVIYVHSILVTLGVALMVSPALGTFNHCFSPPLNGSVAIS